MTQGFDLHNPGVSCARSSVLQNYVCGRYALGELLARLDQLWRGVEFLFARELLLRIALLDCNADVPETINDRSY